MKNGIKVFAPATVSNVACGFDVLGFAIHGPGDEVVGRIVDKKGLVITKITGDNGRLPTDPRKNTAGVAAQAVLDHLGENIGVELEIRKNMPFGSGLGSSAASAVAGAVIINELLRRPLSKRELLPFAMKGEQAADGAYHADNVAPSLLGGMILIRDNPSLDVSRVYTPTSLFATVLYAKIEILTKDSRAVLKDYVSLSAFIQQSGNLASLVLGLINSDFELIQRSLNDVIIEPQRAHLIPHFYEVKEAALNAGALGCSISGAGPSIFALSANSLTAEKVGARMQAVMSGYGIETQLYLSPINNEGATLV